MHPTASSEFVPDGRVGDWSIPGSARSDAYKLSPGIPKSDFWASAKEGIDQVGCMYTAQGFEFDYVGRVLLTRGLRGCYVFFMDAPTRDFFLSRTERRRDELLMTAERPEVYEE
jgi:uncharacterized protein